MRLTLCLLACFLPLSLSADEARGRAALQAEYDASHGYGDFESRLTMTLVAKNGREVAVLYPEKRVYPVAEMPTTEAAIDNGVFRDIYLVIGDRQPDGTWAVRSYVKPFANWIWAGCIIMALGGGLSLTDRRFRVAAGARKSPKGVPAE